MEKEEEEDSVKVEEDYEERVKEKRKEVNKEEV